MGEMFGKLTAAWEGKGPPLGVGSFVLLLAISALAAIVVAQLYVQFYGRRATGSEIHRAFPLIAIAVTAIFICTRSFAADLGDKGAPAQSQAPRRSRFARISGKAAGA